MLVHFKKHEGDVIAFFIDVEHGLMSYQHIGQHAEASRQFYRECEECDFEEYESLLKELYQIGYDNITVVMSKKRFEEYLEVGWDYAIEKVVREQPHPRTKLRDLTDIYYMGYKHMVNDDPDDGLCFELRQFAVQQILNLLEG